MAELPPDSSSAGANMERLIQELACNPDRPVSLHIQSSINRALAPRRAAVDQVLDAMAARLRIGSSPITDAAVAAAIAHWEKVCDCIATADDIASFSADAVKAEARRTRNPPPIESIVSGLTGQTDVGYDMRIHLQGMRGTWHRLWGMVVLCVCMGGVPDEDDGVSTVRKQMEQLLKRELSALEWKALVSSATEHAKQMPSLGSGE